MKPTDDITDSYSRVVEGKDCSVISAAHSRKVVGAYVFLVWPPVFAAIQETIKGLPPNKKLSK
jgi:hypothetical protein